MAEAITVHCPSCETAFPVDPEKVPSGGVDARCSECSAVFRVEDPAAASGSQADSAEPRGDAQATDGAAFVDAPDGTHGASGLEVDDGDDFQTEDYFFQGGREDAPTGLDQEETGGGLGLEAPAGEDQKVEDVPPESDGAATTAPPAFGQRTPEEKAQRLARVLVSDMITYNPQLYQDAVANGTLKEDFEEEIEKSWEEYVEQVGEDLAGSTGYWTDALNDILAEGEDIF